MTILKRNSGAIFCNLLCNSYSMSGASSSTSNSLCGVRQLIFSAFALSMVVFVAFEYSAIIGWIGDFFAFLIQLSIDGYTVWIVFILIGIDLIAIPCLIPSAVFAIGAGFVFGSIFGQWIGWIVAAGTTFVGIYAGSALAFILGRFLLRDFVERLDQRSETWKCIDLVVAKNGIKLVALTKLCILTPWNVFNYLISSTAIEFKHFLIGNLGIFPTILVESFVGTSLSSIFEVSLSSTGTISINISETSGKVYWIYIGVASVISFVLLVWIAIVSRREVSAMMDHHASASLTDSSSAGQIPLSERSNDAAFSTAPA
jgi:uncharacterized membrane protein YdjX (TVP38/TMEM64 family)